MGKEYNHHHHHHHHHLHHQSQSQSQSQPSWLTRSLVARTFYVLLPLLFLHLYFFSRPIPTPPNLTYPPQEIEIQPPPSQQQQQQQYQSNPTTTTPPPLQEECDYFAGRWVRDDTAGYVYNDTTCSTIKKGQNCMAHGRPDLGYLRWRWGPSGCDLPSFDAVAFLRMLQNKHLAFVGDSLARNQLESLLCLLSSVSTPELVYRDSEDNKFRRWRFPPPYNATVSVYWSPFLVRGVEKDEPNGLNHNTLYLDAVDERWAAEMDGMDVIVLSIGHWFLHPAVYLDNNGTSVIGCHYCPTMNHTEVGFYEVFRMAFDTALDEVINNVRGKEKYVVVTTFSPSHFVGEWDKAGACPQKEPYEDGEKVVEGMDAEMRARQVEAVEAARRKASTATAAIEALDVTRLAILRPDGHPGPYMHPFPFANGVQDRVQNDCVHWCLPGPIDTWNEILLAMLRRWWWNQRTRLY